MMVELVSDQNGIFGSSRLPVKFFCFADTDSQRFFNYQMRASAQEFLSSRHMKRGRIGDEYQVRFQPDGCLPVINGGQAVEPFRTAGTGRQVIIYDLFAAASAVSKNFGFGQERFDDAQMALADRA